MYINKLDHFVLTVKDIKAAMRFYTDVLGMDVVQADGNSTAVQFGENIIKFHHHADGI